MDSALMLQVTMVLLGGLIMCDLLVSGQQRNFFPRASLLSSFPIHLQLPFEVRTGVSNAQYYRCDYEGTFDALSKTYSADDC